jgi:hypothetical protein
MGRGTGAGAGQQHHQKSSRKRNPRKPPRQRSTLEIIDEHLLAQIAVTMGGVSKKISILEAIMLQLVQKEAAGDLKATRVLSRFEQLRCRPTTEQVEVVFEGGEYTGSPTEGADG